MKKYVVGFMFVENGDLVVLIEKKKPDWQRGMFNGTGGHIKDGEAPGSAMVREFEEETGAKTSTLDWFCFAIMQVSENDTEIYFFSSFVAAKVSTVTDETVALVPVDYLDTYRIVPDLAWLIPMARQARNIFAKIMENKKGGIF
jgi:8-oxo-dGTP pyrophosphatase MutT (NUDIX family)